MFPIARPVCRGGRKRKTHVGRWRNDGNFASERDVVKEEISSAISREIRTESFYHEHRKEFVRRPSLQTAGGIGNIEELDASKLPEVKAFHSTFYRAGQRGRSFASARFQSGRARGFGVKIFRAQVSEAVDGKFPPRVAVKKPLAQGGQTHTTYSPRAPLPAVAITYLAPSIAQRFARAFVAARSGQAANSAALRKDGYEAGGIFLCKASHAIPNLREDLGLRGLPADFSERPQNDRRRGRLAEQGDRDVSQTGRRKRNLQKAKNVISPGNWRSVRR